MLGYTKKTENEPRLILLLRHFYPLSEGSQVPKWVWSSALADPTNPFGLRARTPAERLVVDSYKKLQAELKNLFLRYVGGPSNLGERGDSEIVIRDNKFTAHD